MLHSSLRNLAVLFIHLIATLPQVIGSGRRPFHRRGVASPPTPTPDRESLPATSVEFPSLRLLTST